jgi:cytochrome c biogenesis protein
MKTTNPIWKFFASVKLALFTLSTLALTSIIGTLIPQNETFSFYSGKYGPKMAQFFDLLNIPDMYNSWWFLSLLGLLSLNLIVCSIDRFPGVWKQITADNLSTPPSRIEKMANNTTWSVNASIQECSKNVIDHLKTIGWQSSSKEIEGGTLIFSQKSAWSRTGVYIVHVSILVIFLGAIVGHFTGFKGSVMIPEMQSSNKIYPFDNNAPIELGFEIRCDEFNIEFYRNGMPKEYTSHLTVLENGKEVLKKSIEVNSPLRYKGITFYQSSYEGYKNLIMTITPPDGTPKTFLTEFQKQTKWAEQNLEFGVINAEAISDRLSRAKVWFSDGQGEPSVFWMQAGTNATIQRSDKTYTLNTKQMYATGLQVAKDPGVWIVYIGCGLMMLGLYCAFFFSHKRIWVLVRNENRKSAIILAGSANKNKTAFEKQFSDISTSLSEKIV